jgi:hypothetical protein
MVVRPRIGFALGSGAARGWSHIGVIEASSRTSYADARSGVLIADALGEGERSAGALRPVGDLVHSVDRVTVPKRAACCGNHRYWRD